LKKVPFRESGSKGSRYLAGNINIFVDAARYESNGQTLALGIIFNIGDRAGRHKRTTQWLAVSSTSLKLIFT
jgi:hypothetical protein